MKRTVALVLLTCAGWALAACGGSGGGSAGPSQAACKAALQQRWDNAFSASPAPAGTDEPSACKGLPNDVVLKLANEIMSSIPPSAP